MRIIRINTNLILSVIILIFGVFIGYSIIAQAQTGGDIVYPVEELNNCRNETECRSFCDKSENIIACVNFAEKHNLISKEEVSKAKAFAQMGKGPGNCKSKDECETFCENPTNMEVCLDFAEKNNLMPPDELKEAKQVVKALREGAQLPGNCRNKKECEVYCNDPANINSCLDFAEKAGFIPPEELKEARQAAKAMASGIKPPGNCRGKKQCEIYCSELSHMEECFNFAEAAGFIPPEEIEQARKMMPLMIKGEMPGGCRSKEGCEAFCADESHSEECANFAIKAGFMKPEEAEMFRKTGGKGPGNCKGKEQCEAFCNDSTNQEICFGFAKEHGLIPEEDIQKMKEGSIRMKEGLSQAPPQVTDCIRQAVGTENFDKFQTGEFMPGQQIGNQVRNCFEQFTPKGMNPNEKPEKHQEIIPGRSPSEGFGGPGGCSNPDECKKYCSDPANQGKCDGFGSRQQMPSEMPPSGQKMMPEGFRPTEKMIPQGIPEEYRKMMEQGQIPSGFTPPPGANYPIPPEGINIPPKYQNIITPPIDIQPLPKGEILPLPPTETTPPPPTSSIRPQTFLGFILNTISRLINK
ncbi:MAG: hypothetical protein AAB696_00055 [Patescibacteria group bacterium]